MLTLFLHWKQLLIQAFNIVKGGVSHTVYAGVSHTAYIGVSHTTFVIAGDRRRRYQAPANNKKQTLWWMPAFIR